MKYKLLFFSIIFSIISCSQSNKKEYQITESSKITLTLERGVFHNDKFVLSDTIITYYPSSEKNNEKFDKYYQISEQKISKEARDQFIKHIVDHGFFNLKDAYTSSTTCNSHITVTLKLNNQLKKITSEDFQRSCPDLLKYIEKKIIRMHGKDLKRIFLPG